MKIERTLKTIRLTDKQSASLDRLAEEHNALARSGRTTGKPSWSVLVSLIADGAIRLVAAGNGSGGNRRRKKRKKAFKAQPGYPPTWWKPDTGLFMKVGNAIDNSGLTAREILDGGLNISNGLVIFPFARYEWDAWRVGEPETPCGEATTVDDPPPSPTPRQDREPAPSVNEDEKAEDEDDFWRNSPFSPEDFHTKDADAKKEAGSDE